MIPFVRTLTAALLLIAVCARATMAADPAQVFVDGRDPAFLVVQGVAEGVSAQALGEMSGYATLENVSLVPWRAFRQNAQALIQPHIVHDEYPGGATILGVVALVKAYPGKSFAVTWNGGLAVTFQDFQYAETSYQAFRADAVGYQRRRPTDPRTDPINPQTHFEALLNR